MYFFLGPKVQIWDLGEHPPLRCPEFWTWGLEKNSTFFSPHNGSLIRISTVYLYFYRFWKFVFFQKVEPRSYTISRQFCWVQNGEKKSENSEIWYVGRKHVQKNEYSQKAIPARFHPLPIPLSYTLFGYVETGIRNGYTVGTAGPPGGRPRHLCRPEDRTQPPVARPSPGPEPPDTHYSAQNIPQREPRVPASGIWKNQNNFSPNFFQNDFQKFNCLDIMSNILIERWFIHFFFFRRTLDTHVSSMVGTRSILSENKYV